MASTQTAARARDVDQDDGPAVWRTELSPVSFLRRAAAVHADATAVVHGARRYDRDLHERVTRRASASRGLGLERGDRVAVLAPNTPAMVEAHFAVPATGGLLVCINIRQSPGEVACLLGVSSPRSSWSTPSTKASCCRRHRPGRSDPHRRHRRAVLPLRAAPRLRRARRPPRGAARRGGPARDQLHLGHDRGFQGRRLHAPGAYLNALANVIEVGLRPGPGSSSSLPSSTATAGASRWRRSWWGRRCSACAASTPPGCGAWSTRTA